ncbi:MAG TPA: SET domain-containing protein [Ignavibacteriales bacterium]|nr:SET domain-containing protein [Ignavibacteriales bacterium]
MGNKDNSHLIEVRNSGIHGNGLFATEDIAPGELVLIVAGEVIDESEALRREAEDGNVYIFYNGDSFIDAAGTDKIKYINHSCLPNCEVQDRDEASLNLVSVKPIKKGEEVTIDYGYDEIYDQCNCDVCTDKKDE